MGLSNKKEEQLRRMPLIQNRIKAAVVLSSNGPLVSFWSNSRAIKTRPFLIHCLGRSVRSRP